MRTRAILTALLCATAIIGCDSSRDLIIDPTANPTKPQAAAQVLPLTGEAFFSDNFQLVGECDPSAVGPFQFGASGAAVGPYPGTFNEGGGMFSVGPGAGQLSARFDINSTSQVFGGKEVGGALFCEGGIVSFSGQGFYAADINGFVDEGFTQVDLVYDQSTRTGFFSEHFLFSTVQAVVLLDPPAAENPAGTKHTVTATVLFTTRQPAVGVVVRFDVFSPSGFTASGSCVTDANGQCSFTYQGPNQPDVNTIQACAEMPGFPANCGFATKVWLLPASTPGKVTGGGHIVHAGAVRGVSFGFNASLAERGFHGRGVVVDHQTDTRIKLLDVTLLVIAGTHATIQGNAEVNGVPTTYTIDVDDLNEPGTLRDTFKITTGTGYVAGGLLTGGNIQIHK